MYKQIKDVCEIIGGMPAPQEDSSFDRKGFPFVRMKDLGKYHLTNNLIEVTDRVSETFYKKYKNRVVKKGAILLPRSGSVALNHRAILGIDAFVVSHICALQVKDSNLNNSFLYYALRNIRMDTITKKTTGLDAITFEDLGKIKIPIPPLTEQKHIAEILDKADLIRQKRKESIALLDEFLRSVFLDMFGDPVRNEKGWDLKELSYFGKWESGGTPSRNIKEYFNGNIPWYTSGELNSMYTSFSIENINEIAIKESNTKLIKPNSLLLGMYDTAALKSSISTINCTCNQAIVFSSLSEKPNHIIYIYFCIQIGREYYRSKQRGVRQKNMNLSMIKNLKIPNPPIKLQSQFAKIVEQVEATKSKMEESLKEMDNQFNGLLQKVFS